MNTVSENTESNVLYTMLGTVRLLTIKSNDGYSESIVVPNDDEATIKRAINKIHTENYVDSHCVNWKYNNSYGYGSYFDQVMWEDVTIDVTELRVL